MKNKAFSLITGLVVGAANGFFGSGGGTIAVPMLKKSGLETKSAHAASLVMTLPLSVVSAVMYANAIDFDMKQTIALIPWGLAGAYIGTRVMKKISSEWLSLIFGLILIIAGGRNLLT